MEIAANVQLWLTPGHTDYDLSVIVRETCLGTVVIAGTKFLTAFL